MKLQSKMFLDTSRDMSTQKENSVFELTSPLSKRSTKNNFKLKSMLGLPIKHAFKVETEPAILPLALQKEKERELNELKGYKLHESTFDSRIGK